MKNKTIMTQGLQEYEREEARQEQVQPNAKAVRVSVEFTKSTIFVIPQGVNQIRIVAIGASGGSGNGFGVLLNNGGEGGTAVSNIDTNPDESLEIFVGVRGQDGGLPKGGSGGSSTSGFEGGAAASGSAGGGGGGGLYGGGAGSEYDYAISGGGAGGTGTLDKGLSIDGGGVADGRVVISYSESRKVKNEVATALGDST